MATAAADNPSFHKGEAMVLSLSEKLGAVLFFGSLTAFVLWCVFGLELGTFSFLVTKVIVIPALLLGVSFVGLTLWTHAPAKGDMILLFLGITFLAGIMVTASAYGHKYFEQGQVENKVSQQYEKRYHAHDAMLSSEGTYETSQGKVVVYKVTSPDLKKSEFIAVRGHGNSIDSLEKISQKQIEKLKNL